MSFAYLTGPKVWSFCCRNCRWPLEWWPGVGWLHVELEEYASVRDPSCTYGRPICMYASCDHNDGLHLDCACRCHE